MALDKIAKIQRGQQFIINYFQKLPQDPNTPITIDWDLEDSKLGLYRLVTHISGKRYTKVLLEEELIDDFGTQKWEDRLKRKVDGLLKKGL